MAEATPQSRDRFVDFLRAASITTVVLGHWCMAVITSQDGKIVLYNVIGVTRGLWMATWVLQVMPLFFFVGGFSDAVTLDSYGRRGIPARRFLISRIARLGGPTLVFVMVWTAVELGLHLTGVGGSGAIRGFRLGNIPFGPLWFVGVYLVISAAAPVTLRIHRRYAMRAAAALMAGAAAVDAIAFGAHLPWLRWANLWIVWLLAHQLGYFYADGTLPRLSRRAKMLMAFGGLLALTILTNLGVYPRSMVGTDAAFFALRPIERISNMGPPTICVVALTFWLVGLALLLREPALRWLQRPGPWSATILVNSVIMTVYLWHMTAYAIVILLFRPLGMGKPLYSTVRWWAERPFWELAPAVMLLLLVWLFGRFETGALSGLLPRGPASLPAR